MLHLADPDLETFGQIYVVRYDNSLVKVGKSYDAHIRIRSLRSDTFKPGRLVGSWSSDLHVPWHLNELRMLVFCHERYGQPVTGLETFRGSYDEVLTYAQNLPLI